MHITIISLILAISLPASMVWSQKGHRITGVIAEKYLSDNARAEIHKILGNESLAEVSTYPDEQRSNPAPYWKKTAMPWHWVTVPDGQTYSNTTPPKEGDAYIALMNFKKILKDKTSSLADKQLALKFTIHLVGDLHQPLHVGNGTDRGGNSVKVKWFRKSSNLHKVWDSEIIEGQGLSYSEKAEWLNEKISPVQAKAWMETNPLVWIAESQELRKSIYPEKASLSYDYAYKFKPIIDERLMQSGVRMAAYLNEVFGE